MAVNTFFSDLLKKREPQRPVRMILQVEDRETALKPTFLSSLGQIRNVRVVSQAFNFVTVVAPVSTIPALEQTSVRVHYDLPRGIILAPFTHDEIYGNFSLSTVTIPFTRQEMIRRNLLAAPKSLFMFPATIGAQFGIRTRRLTEPRIIVVTTGESRELMLPPKDSSIRKTKVAVIDTGLTIPHPQINLLSVRPALRSVTGELPFDGLGHGQHTTTTAFGGLANTDFGVCQGVATCVGNTLMHVKGLSNAGFGSESQILKAMEIAIDWGAKVISMSLGGPLQGSVDEDPECQAIKQYKDDVIFVVAAGNSGPSGWTIGSPGASPYAVTVGAYSTAYKDVAIFSSRGPSAEYYQSHAEQWRADSQRYGEDISKPDCLAPGGGPVKEGDKVDEIYSGVTGWTNGIGDDNPLDFYDAMRGTSMATPHASGIISLAYEAGLVKTAAEIRARLKKSAIGGKSVSRGYGVIDYQRITTV